MTGASASSGVGDCVEKHYGGLGALFDSEPNISVVNPNCIQREVEKIYNDFMNSPTYRTSTCMELMKGMIPTMGTVIHNIVDNEMINEIEKVGDKITDDFCSSPEKIVEYIDDTGEITRLAQFRGIIPDESYSECFNRSEEECQMMQVRDIIRNMDIEAPPETAEALPVFLVDFEGDDK